MNWQQKPWGYTACLFASDTVEFWSAHVLAGGYSSRHWHDLKWNRLASRGAVLRVTTYDDRGQVAVSRVIEAGQSIDVPPLVMHRFEVLESGKIWETYWGRCHVQDIVRMDANGWRPPQSEVA